MEMRLLLACVFLRFEPELEGDEDDDDDEVDAGGGGGAL